jgi:signal peptidase II
VRDSRAILLLAIAAAVVALDQATKHLAEANLSRFESVEVIGEVLRFRLAYNDGAAFSFGFGHTWVLTIISTIAVLALLWFGPRAKTKLWVFIAGVILGGATGNLIDRLFKDPSFANGHVVDFIQIPFNFPIFNIADIALVTGVSLVVLRTLLGDEIGGGRVIDRIDEDAESAGIANSVENAESSDDALGKNEERA